MRRNKVINQNCKNQKRHKFNDNQNYNKTMNWEKTEMSKNKIIRIKIKTRIRTRIGKRKKMKRNLPS